MRKYFFFFFCTRADSFKVSYHTFNRDFLRTYVQLSDIQTGVGPKGNGT